MYKLGVLGSKISYSMSPLIHNEFAKQFDIDIDYQIFDIAQEPEKFVIKFFNEGGHGLNITKPFKESFSNKFSNSPESINCIFNSGAKSTSTDGVGLVGDLKSKKIKFETMNILVYGLGGAAKSILKALTTNKSIFIANRTEEKTTKMLEQNPLLKKYNGEQLDLVISCAKKLDLNTIKFFEHLNIAKTGIIYDINYSNQTNALFSELLLVEEGNLYNGIGMLVEQAAESFSLWFDMRPRTEKIKQKINEGL